MDDDEVSNRKRALQRNDADREQKMKRLRVMIQELKPSVIREIRSSMEQAMNVHYPTSNNALAVVSHIQEVPRDVFYRIFSILQNDPNGAKTLVAFCSVAKNICTEEFWKYQLHKWYNVDAQGMTKREAEVLFTKESKPSFFVSARQWDEYFSYAMLFRQRFGPSFIVCITSAYDDDEVDDGNAISLDIYKNENGGDQNQNNFLTCTSNFLQEFQHGDGLFVGYTEQNIFEEIENPALYPFARAIHNMYIQRRDHQIRSGLNLVELFQAIGALLRLPMETQIGHYQAFDEWDPPVDELWNLPTQRVYV